MATAKHGKYVRTYFDQHRVDRWASATALDFSRDSSEYTPLSEEYKLFLPGKAGATSTLNGFIDVDTVTGFDIVQYTDVITPGTHYICRTQFAGTSAAQGDIAYETQEFNTGASRAYDQAGIGMLNWSGQVTDGFYRGSVLLPKRRRRRRALWGRRSTSARRRRARCSLRRSALSRWRDRSAPSLSRCKSRRTTAPTHTPR